MVKSLAMKSKLIIYLPELNFIKLGQQSNSNSELVNWYENGKSLQLDALCQADLVVVGTSGDKNLLLEKISPIPVFTEKEAIEGGIKLQELKEKKTSIIILTFNQLSDTKLTVESLEKNTEQRLRAYIRG